MKWVESRGEMNVLVSVIIPVYNTEINMLKKCVSGVLEQSFRDFELIIVDDCSTREETLSYLTSIDNIAPNIKIFHLGQNIGIAGSRNYGIDHAAGEWLCFLDHDDYWEKTYLEDILNTSKCAEADIIISGYTIVDEADKLIRQFPMKRQEFKSEYYAYSTSAPWNRLIKRQFLIDNNIRYPDGCLVEDIPFNMWCNVLAERIVIAEIYGYCNRVNSHSTSRSAAFEEMPFEKMPFETLEKVCRTLSANEKEYKACSGAMVEVVTLLSCLFCRRSSAGTIRTASERGAALLRRYIKHYIISSFKFVIHVDSRISVKLLQLGFAIAVFLHVEKVYCLCMAKALSVVS